MTGYRSSLAQGEEIQKTLRSYRLPRGSPIEWPECVQLSERMDFVGFQRTWTMYCGLSSVPPTVTRPI